MLGLQEYEGAPVTALRGATRRAYDALVQLAIAERVDLVLLAGDIYDGDWPDANTGLYFIQGLHQLNKVGIPVVLLTGNHDAANRITRKLTYPGNVRVLPTDSSGTERFESHYVAVHGQGYRQQEERGNLVCKYPRRVEGWFNIGLLHTALEGRDGYDNYAPCTVQELKALGYDYWALGHIHQRESVNQTLSPRIEFPGCIQGRSVRECGAKGCLIVEVDDRQHMSVTFHPLDVVRWQVVALDAADCEDRDAVREAAVAAVEAARAGADGRLLAVRVEITAGEAVFPALSDLRADLCGSFSDGVWIEKVLLRCTATPTVTPPTLGEDAESELRAVLQCLMNEADSFDKLINIGDCGKLKALLPREVAPDWTAYREEILTRAGTLLFTTVEAES